MAEQITKYTFKEGMPVEFEILSPEPEGAKVSSKVLFLPLSSLSFAATLQHQLSIAVGGIN